MDTQVIVLSKIEPRMVRGLHLVPKSKRRRHRRSLKLFTIRIFCQEVTGRDRKIAPTRIPFVNALVSPIRLSIVIWKFPKQVIGLRAPDASVEEVAVLPASRHMPAPFVLRARKICSSQYTTHSTVGAFFLCLSVFGRYCLSTECWIGINICKESQPL